MMSLAVSAQEKNPQQGDFTVALTLGYNSSVMQNAAAGNLYNYSLQAASTNWNDKALTVGIEGGWFFRDLWKLNLGGGMNITKAPGYGPLPGTAESEEEFEMGDIPNYGAVSDRSVIQFQVYTGVDRYFRTKVDGLLPYVGLRVGYAYGRERSMTDDETYMGESVGEAIFAAPTLKVGFKF